MNLSLEVLRQLGDGRWRSCARLLQKLDGCIQPERAARRYSDTVEHASDMPLGDKIDAGRRMLIVQAVEALRRQGRVEVDGKGFGKRARLKPYGNDTQGRAVLTALGLVGKAIERSHVSPEAKAACRGHCEAIRELVEGGR